MTMTTGSDPQKKNMCCEVRSQGSETGTLGELQTQEPAQPSPSNANPEPKLPYIIFYNPVRIELLEKDASILGNCVWW